MLGERGIGGTPAWEVAELGNLLGRGLVLEWDRHPSAPWLPEGADPPCTRRADDAGHSKLRGERQPGERGLWRSCLPGTVPGLCLPCLGHRAAPFSCFSSRERKQGPANSRVL